MNLCTTKSATFWVILVKTKIGFGMPKGAQFLRVVKCKTLIWKQIYFKKVKVQKRMQKENQTVPLRKIRWIIQPNCGNGNDLRCSFSEDVLVQVAENEFTALSDAFVSFLLSISIAALRSHANSTVGSLQRGRHTYKFCWRAQISGAWLMHSGWNRSS